jgi:hypothetical protein
MRAKKDCAVADFKEAIRLYPKLAPTLKAFGIRANLAFYRVAYL